jgi:hypothetical protein
MKRIWIPTLLVLIVAAGVYAVDKHYSNKDRYTFKDRFSADLAGIDTLGIEIVNGSIETTAWSGNSVEIEITEQVKAGDEAEAEDIAGRVKLVGRRSGSKLQIELDLGGVDRDEIYNKYNYSCSLKVQLPARLELDGINTINGCIKIPAMDRSVKADTTNGSITLAACGGDAYLETTNGTIETGLVAGKLEAETTNGDVVLEGAGGPVVASTTNGRISATLKEALKGNIDLSTTNGSIKLRVGRGSSMQVYASTSSGKVYTDASGGIDGEFNRRHTRFKGSIGGGNYSVELNTTNGSITIEEI